MGVVSQASRKWVWPVRHLGDAVEGGGEGSSGFVVLDVSIIFA